MATPYVTIVRNVVGSTQDLAADELQHNDRPVLVVAARQTAGRGRSGNEWWHAPRAVAASLAFSAERFPIEDTFSLAVGQAVRAAIRAAVSVDVGLKWPNDLELAGSKVGGILVERDEHRVVVGCGLNLCWPEPPAGARGLLVVDPGDHIGQKISELWATAVLESAGAWDRVAYVEACSTLGEDITWVPAGRGTAVTVDDRGGLVVDTDNGRVVLRSGEVRAVRRVAASGDA